MKKLLQKNLFIFVTDVILSVGASVAAFLLLRFYLSAIPDFVDYLLAWFFESLVASFVAVLLSKTYRIIFSYASFKAVWNIITCVAIKEVLLVIVLLISPLFDNSHPHLLVTIDFSFSLLVMLLHKSSLLLYTNRNARFGEEKEVERLNVMVYGTTEKSVAIVTRYQKSSHYNIKGFLTRDKSLAGKIILDCPVIYIPESLTEFHVKDAEAVLFASQAEMKAESDLLVKFCDEKGICVLSVPSAKTTNYTGLEITEIKHILENQFIPDRMTGLERSVKRLIDLSISAVLIVLFSPLMLIVYVVVAIEDGHPVIYKQERIGRFGRPFNILKFRTMRLDAESAGPALYSGEDDPRMTKVGKFLRAHHLDELPQLFNVFWGQMSFVGYRPERKVFIDQIVKKDPRYAYLYQIRPGVTSYATLKNGYTDTLDKMLRRLKYDLYYLNHRSIFFDIKVLWETFLSIAVGKKF